MTVLGSLISSLWPVIGLSCLYPPALTVYRIYFHPLRKFPGPLLARLTFWTELYWDVIRRGQYVWRLEEWHRQYGPIIRISPDELHINDPPMYDVIYPSSAANRRVDKWPMQARVFGNPHSAFGTSNHELHRMRRAQIAPLFNRRAVLDLQPLINDKIDFFIERLRRLKGTGVPVSLFAAFAALTGDVISQYSFGEAVGFLESDDFAPDWHQLIQDSAALGAVGKQFGFFWPLLQAIPPKLLHAVNPAMERVTYLKNLVDKRIREVKLGKKSPTKNNQRTIFHEILESDPSLGEKSSIRLQHEGEVIMPAGTATTADTLAILCFHILDQPQILHRIQDELRPVMLRTGGSPKCEDVEKLPYLTAVIKEGLRICPGVSARLPRVDPDHAITYEQWSIPAGTPVSLSPLMIHYDPMLFPKPHEFIPDRWLSEPSKLTHKLDKHIVSFSKGTRQCVGITLAWAEMYLTLAAIFGRHDLHLELFETTTKDVTVVADIFNPGFPPESKGVRALVT